MFNGYQIIIALSYHSLNVKYYVLIIR